MTDENITSVGGWSRALEVMRNGDSTTIFWTAGRYTALEWFRLLQQDRSAIRKVVRKSWSPSTPHKFTLKDAYRLAAQHRSALTKNMRRPVESRVSKSDPWVLAMLLGTARVPRLRRQVKDDLESHQQYAAYRRGHRAGLSFAAWQRLRAEKKRQRNVEPAAARRRRDGNLARRQVSKLWKARSDVPERQRGGQIALRLKISLRHVNRIIGELNLRSTR
jgi:hypothetical protein